MIEKMGLSSVDDVGSVFIGTTKVYRGINKDSIDSVQELLRCGLINELEKKGLFPITRVSTTQVQAYELVIEHEKIGPITYPFEWSPEMLRSAALCVLEVNEIANKYGYELKDCHPYNVLFRSMTPVFVDFGSFKVKVNDHYSWCAYEEFLGCYYYALLAKEKKLDLLYKNNFLYSGRGVGATELATMINPLFKFLGFSITNIILTVISAYRHGDRYEKTKVELLFKKKVLISIADFLLRSPKLPFRIISLRKLKNKINKINLAGKSSWGNYHEDSGYYTKDGEVSLSDRLQWVLGKCQELQPKTVIELAGNQGVLSRELVKEEYVDNVLCTDYDFYSVDKLFLNTKEGEGLSTACFDFMAGTWAHITKNERLARLKSEMVIALAVSHHLLLTQNYLIGDMLKIISSYTRKYLIIEFMPLGLWNGVSAPPTPKWYTEDWFTVELLKFCSILERESFGKNRVVFICEIKPQMPE